MFFIIVYGLNYSFLKISEFKISEFFFKTFIMKIIKLGSVNQWNVISKIFSNKMVPSQLGDKLYKLAKILKEDDSDFYRLLISSFGKGKFTSRDGFLIKPSRFFLTLIKETKTEFLIF